jgi:hypothetical protein
MVLQHIKVGGLVVYFEVQRLLREAIAPRTGTVTPQTQLTKQA